MEYGFVYLWFDRKHRRYYIGSHWGDESDGYICSSKWMRNAYARRPHDFKRKILNRVTSSRADLLNEEQKWLDMIQPHEIKVRYYNLCLTVKRAWHTYEETRLSIGERISRTLTGTKHTEEAKRNMSLAHKGKSTRPCSEETKAKISVIHKGRKAVGRPFDSKSQKGKRLSEETRRKISEAGRGRPVSEETRRKISEARKK